MTIPRPTTKTKRWAVAQFLEISPLSPKELESSTQSLAYETTKNIKLTMLYFVASLAFWDGPQAEKPAIWRDGGLMSQDQLKVSAQLWLFERKRQLAERVCVQGDLSESSMQKAGFCIILHCMQIGLTLQMFSCLWDLPIGLLWVYRL